MRAFVRELIVALESASDGHFQTICSDLRELVLDLEEVWGALEHAYP